MAFTRTASGMAEKWRFHQVPTVWVEGPTDLFFYPPISTGIPCRFEAFHGCENARALICALKENDYPYLVVLDGDYSVLERKRSPHRRVVVLPRYSFENFLWEPAAINTACLRHARCGDQKDLVVNEMEKIVRTLNKELLPAIILDVAARKMDTAPDVLPDRVEPLLKNATSTEFDGARLKALVKRAKTEVDKKFARDSATRVRSFLQERCISHLIAGHLLFGLLRRTFVQAANKERGSKSVTADDALLQMLSDAVWKSCRVGDHKWLKRNFRSKLRKLTLHFP